ncbi:ABC transporter permease [Kineosporia babensis]|uniref:Transport permease protein n=1 Tax=Kineosporia babensis TaxID=499548 RepID=A0A9X1N9S9_9ACTN|nr:ABC transporter permease [Kineosporia babensis]MCD5310190.1 ABC transporter permease [Kineosporia babensis]
MSATTPPIGTTFGSTSLFREALVIAGRTLLHWRAQPGLIAVNLLFPVMILLMMGGLFGGAVAGSTGDYFVYVLPGVLALNMMFGIEATMTALASDANKTVTDRFRSLPISGGAVLLGRVLADLLTSVVELVALSCAGFLLGWRWENGILPALAAYALLLTLRFSMLWLGVFIGIRAGKPEALMGVQILVWPIGFLSTVFIDPRTMPTFLGWIAELNPISAVATSARELFSGRQIEGVSWAATHALPYALISQAVLVAVFAALGVRAYRRLGQ